MARTRKYISRADLIRKIHNLPFHDYMAGWEQIAQEGKYYKVTHLIRKLVNDAIKDMPYIEVSEEGANDEH